MSEVEKVREYWQRELRQELARVTAERDQLAADRRKLMEALELADQYITNGIELGYIDLPDAPDPALETPIKVRKALDKIKAREDGDE